jgi:hypothetical protein
MALARLRFTIVAMCMTVLTASGASAQVFGTFRWQMQPFCNVVTMTITQVPSGFTLDGFDEQCGGVKRASSIGMALINPDGTVGLEFTIVAAPSGKAAHVSASINPGTGSGTWIDSVGNSGNFVLAGATPGLPARPLPPDGPPGNFNGGIQDLALTSTDVVVRSLTLTVPASGKVIVSASGSFAFRAGSAVNEVARCSITTAAIVDGSNRFVGQDGGVINTVSMPFGATRGFPVDPGAFTVNLVCGEVFGNVVVQDTNLTAVFVAQ